MRERLFVLGLVGLLAGAASVQAHEEGTTPPTPEGSAGGTAPAAPRPAKPAAVAPTGKSATAGKTGASRPLRLTLEEKDRATPAAPAAAARGGGHAEPAPAGSRPAAADAAPAAEAGDVAAVKRGTPLKLAPSAKEIESERKTVLKPPVENRPDRYENQRQDIPAPTQVRRVPGPGSSVGSTAAERKATMIENSGPQQNTTYRRW